MLKDIIQTVKLGGAKRNSEDLERILETDSFFRNSSEKKVIPARIQRALLLLRQDKPSQGKDVFVEN